MSSKNILIINPSFPEWKYDFVKSLYELGNPCLAICPKDSDLDINHFKWLSKVEFLDSNEKNFKNFDKEIKSIVKKFGKIDHIESFEEYWKTLESKLRNSLTLPGRGHLEQDIISSKYQAKKLFLKANVNVADSVVPLDMEEARNFFKYCDKKIIVKPEFGVGGQGFNKIFSFDDLNKINFSKKIILERYLEGEIFTYDALVNKRGSPVDSFCLNYPPLDRVLNNESESAIFVLKEMPQELEKIGRRCVKEFNCKNEFVHMEFIKHNGEFYAMDANIRICGAYPNYLYNMVSNQKIEDLWAKSILDLEIESNIEHKNYAGLFSRRYNKVYQLTDKELESKLKDNLVNIKHFPEIFSNCMNNYGFFVKANSLEELKEIQELIQK